MINSVAELIEAAGGHEATMKYFDVCLSAPAMWKIRGYLPPRHIVKALTLAQMNGLTIDPGLFEPPAKRRRRLRR